MPQASPESLHGAVWVGDDGCVDPHTATYALADAARALGVEIRTRTQVTGIRLGRGREVRAVETAAGPIETEAVVNACGIWAPQVAAMVGAFTPSVPVDHQHIARRRWTATSSRATCRASATPTISCTGARRPAAPSSAATSPTR